MALKIILGVISALLYVNASKLIDLGPFSINTNINKRGKYEHLDKYDLKATAEMDKFLKMSVHNDSYNPFVIRKLPEFDVVGLGMNVELSNLKIVGIKSVKFDNIEMRMNYGVKPKIDPFRIDLKMTAPLIEADVDVDSFLASGHVKVKLLGVRSEVAVKTRIVPKSRKNVEPVFQAYYLGIKGSVHSLQVHLDLGLPDTIENDRDFIKNILNTAKESLVPYAVHEGLVKINEELRKRSAEEVLNLLVPDRPNSKLLVNLALSDIKPN